MDALATFAMWILATIAVVALGAHLLRRTFDRAEVREGLPSKPLLAPRQHRDAPLGNHVGPGQQVSLRPAYQPVARDTLTAPEQPTDSLQTNAAAAPARSISGPSSEQDEMKLPPATELTGPIPESCSSTVEELPRKLDSDILPVAGATIDTSAEIVEATAEAIVQEDANEAARSHGTGPVEAQGSDLSSVDLSRRRQSFHRDRRGRKRGQAPAAPLPEPTETAAEGPAIKASAEVRLLLNLHPIQETVQLSAVLSKPEGYPGTCTIDLNGGTQLHAYDESRYDDIDLSWRPETLASEFRFSAPGGFSWIRSVRRVHIFAPSPTEAGLVSVPAAMLGQEHAIVCRAEDSDFVRTLAQATRSQELQNFTNWRGVPAGWCVFAGYAPRQAAEGIAAGDFSPLDPLYDLKINLVGGLRLRSNAFAEAHAPRIELSGLPAHATVSIDGKPAVADGTGAWQAEGWNAAGPHLIDVVPGPSLSYEIVADPAGHHGWPRWQSEEAVFPTDREVWTRTSICGASIMGAHGETVLAHETVPTLIALDSRGHATPFQRRSDASVSIALPSSPPAFLLVASGNRRHQGEIVWLGLEPSREGIAGSADKLSTWANIVRIAAARRLPIESNGSPEAKALWQKTARRARNVRRRTA
jgi:hypothetical protein